MSAKHHHQRRLTPIKRIWAAIQLAALVGAAAMLGLKHPASIEQIPACPTLTVAHVYCPGCGSLRGMHHLLSGRVAESWRHNPAVLVLGVPVVVFLIITLSMRVITGREGRPLPLPGSVGWIILALIVGYAIARNIPVDGLDPLRPPAVSTGT